MKLPLSWLKDYVDIDCTAEELESRLFSCGFEVEEKTIVGGKTDRIVCCKILSIEKHPNADRLSVVKADAGKFGILQIITSATNIFTGALVPVALDGATLANGETIRAGKIRGVESAGMFCSGEELGITDDWYEGASVNGILILSEDYPLGEDMKKILETEDVMFDINVTANRPDCQSILGLAREVAAALGKPLKMPDLTYTCSNGVSTKNTIKVTDSAFELCPRYISHLITNVKLAKSPQWMRRRLASMGLRSINNIVDITNFVLLEIGQPMHAFDLNDLGGGEINIRRAKPNEKIITLDNKEFTLNENNLVICDAFKPVALAGVMGGLNSEIKESTVAVAFESAKFARDSIRKTSRTLGQRSDSSARYEKGVDFYSPEIGMARALHLVQELKCADIACDEYDLMETRPSEKVIETTLKDINGVLGIEVPSDVSVQILERLNFKVRLNGEKLSVTVPLYREDVEDYPDIAEEIIREYGYSHIKPTLLATSSITNGGRDFLQRKSEAIKTFLVGCGFNEIITYSFVSEKEFGQFGLKCDNAIKILNPISEDMAVMRCSLLPSAVRAVCYNLNRKNENGRLFELAKVYIADSLPLKALPAEKERLSLAVFGDGEDFFTLKGVIETLLEEFCFGKEIEYAVCSRECMHPTRSAEIVCGGEVLGYFGQLNPALMEELGCEKPVYAAELYYDRLQAFFSDKIVYKPISKYPSVERDIAVVVDETVPCGVLMSCVKEAGGEFLEKVSLFDVYTGSGVEKGKKSMAVRLVFVSYDRTLNVEEIEKAVNNILSNLKEKAGAVLR